MTPWLSLALWIPALAALLMAFIPARFIKLIQTLAVSAVGASTLISIKLFLQYLHADLTKFQAIEVMPWFPALGIQYKVGIDGLSLSLILLTGLVTWAVTWMSLSIDKRQKEFFILTLLAMTGVYGVFASLDLFFFVIFYELASIPMYFLVGIWGSDKLSGGRPIYREQAATKLLLYLQLGGGLVLLGILALYFAAGSTSFDFQQLQQVRLSEGHQKILFLLFFVGFAIEAGLVPLHTWLPDAHGEANAPVSMLLAGVLLKMGGYALLRFNVQMLPQVHQILAPALIVLGIVNIIWGALNAFAQDNVKRRIACSSVSHMGFVLLGIGAIDALGMSGAMLQMISHGLIAAAMFFITGVFYERTKTLSIPNMGGLAKVLPITFAFFLASSLASLALPGMSGFISEITVFLGVTSNNDFTVPFRVITVVLAAIGLVLTPVYLLSLCRRVFFGPRIPALAQVGDMKPRELLIGLSLLVPTLVIGFWPRVAIDLYEASTNALANGVANQAPLALAGFGGLG